MKKADEVRMVSGRVGEWGACMHATCHCLPFSAKRQVPFGPLASHAFDPPFSNPQLFNANVRPAKPAPATKAAAAKRR